MARFKSIADEGIELSARIKILVVGGKIVYTSVSLCLKY